MKKWIFPLVLIFVELFFSILYLTPSVNSALPNFLRDILAWFDHLLTLITKLIHLPVLDDSGKINSIISNMIVLILLDIIAISIYFIIYGVKRRKKSSLDRLANQDSLPKSEFDPILFEKRLPTLRLAFIFIPLNLWILYFILLNSLDLQAQFKKNMPGFYKLFKSNIAFYTKNALPLSTDDVLFKLTIFVFGLLAVGFIYWMIFSIFASIYKKPLAKMRSKKALREHEKRINLCQKEEIIVENLEILEHAKFNHSKSIIETIADITPKKTIGIENNKSDYFENLAHGITDLGIVEKEIKQIETPRLERKMIRVMYPLDSPYDNQVIIDQSISNKETQVIPETSDNVAKQESHKTEKISLSHKLDVLSIHRDKNDEKVSKDIAPVTPIDIKKSSSGEPQRKIVKPLKPENLRTPVNVTPVEPIKKHLKDEQSSTPIIEIKD